MRFDATMARVCRRLAKAVSSAADYFSPHNLIARVPVQCAVDPIQAATVFGPQDELNAERSVAHIHSAYLGGVMPEKDGRIVFAGGDEWTIAEQPNLQAGVWDMAVLRVGRQRVGGRREAQ